MARRSLHLRYNLEIISGSWIICGTGDHLRAAPGNLITSSPGRPLAARQNWRACAVIVPPKAWRLMVCSRVAVYVLCFFYPGCIILCFSSLLSLIFVQVSSWTSNSKPFRSNACSRFRKKSTPRFSYLSNRSSQVSHVSSTSWYRPVCFSAVVAFMDAFLACSCPIII